MYHTVRHTSYLMPAVAAVLMSAVATALPTIESVFTIPTVKNGSNHTPQFAESARTPEAHDATLTISKALAMTAFRALQDDEFYRQVSPKRVLLPLRVPSEHLVTES